MTTTKDVRDMLGVTADQMAARPKLSKKKPKTTLPRPDGITRELFALMGERAPPIPIATKPKFKAKLARNTIPSKWRWAPFRNEAREDGLLLSHWLKETPAMKAQDGPSQPQTQSSEAPSPHPTQNQLPTDPSQSSEPATAENKGTDPSTPSLPTDPIGITPSKPYPFAKFNIRLPKVDYTETEYETHLKTEGWSKEETDYLVNLVPECSQKWPVVHDRYDFPQPHTQGEAVDQSASLTKERSMEELKMRFYTVSAKVMELRTPLANMTADDLGAYEKMVKFNPAQEITRKRLKDALLHRSIDEKREEEYLLAELKRIWTHQQRFSSELRDLRSRLDHSLTDEPPDFQPLTSSHAINSVFQKVFQNRDKGKMPRRSITGDGVGSSPVTGGPHGINTAAAQASGTSGVGSTTATPTTATGNKKGASTANSALNQNHRLVSPRHEPRFGITTHDRLTGGITFRSDKLTKARQAKSLTQTQKIAAVLAELGIPDLLQMPTVNVCDAMESLVSKVNLLIDARRVREKEENELKIASQQLRLKKGLPEPEQQGGDGVDANQTGTGESEAQAKSQQENDKKGQKDKDGDVSMADASQADATGKSSHPDGEDEDDQDGSKIEGVEDSKIEGDEEEEEEEDGGKEDEQDIADDNDNDAQGDENEEFVDADDGGDEDEDENEDAGSDANLDVEEGDGDDDDFYGNNDRDDEALDNEEEDDEENASQQVEEDEDEEVEDDDGAAEPDEDDDDFDATAGRDDNDNDNDGDGDNPGDEDIDDTGNVDAQDLEDDQDDPPSSSRPATRNGSMSVSNGAQTPQTGVGTRSRGKRSASVLSAASSTSNAGPSAGTRRGERKRVRR